jgi:hypothetical protein
VASETNFLGLGAYLIRRHISHTKAEGTARQAAEKYSFFASAVRAQLTHLF